MKADGIPKASNVVAVPSSIPKAADPTQKWAIRLRLSLDNLSNLTSVSDFVRDDAIKAHRLPDCMAAHSSVLSNDVFFRQWHMRYSDDNMNLPGFHPQQSERRFPRHRPLRLDLQIVGARQIVPRSGMASG